MFADRREAGRELAGRLSPYADDTSAIVLALPRGGVPVGYEVACALHEHLLTIHGQYSFQDLSNGLASDRTGCGRPAGRGSPVAEEAA